MALMTGPISPYITPDLLTTFPLGISWSTIPDQRASEAERYAAQVIMCQTATGMADTRCNQILRSTQQTELLRGPGSYRVNLTREGTIRLMLSQRPVTSISQIQIAPAVPLPYQWTSIQQGNWAVGIPPLMTNSSSVAADSGMGGQWILVGPCAASSGNRLWAFNTTYQAGWPHAGITQQAAPGDGVLYVDDCTGWAPVPPSTQGAVGVIQDNAAGQEAVAVLAASAATGPGELSLSAPLQYGHAPGILVSCMPSQIQWATALYAASQALTRGATSTTIQTTRGGSSRNSGGGVTLKMAADELLNPFRLMK
jgi:hypothetical protein